MILKQYYLGCLAHASYLVGDEQSGKAAIIDPQRDVDQYFADAEALGLHIEYVFLTHFHADFIAGHVELRNRTGADLSRRKRKPSTSSFRCGMETSSSSAKRP